MKNEVFTDVTPCRLVNSYWRFVERTTSILRVPQSSLGPLVTQDPSVMSLR